MIKNMRKLFAASAIALLAAVGLRADTPCTWTTFNMWPHETEWMLTAFIQAPFYHAGKIYAVSRATTINPSKTFFTVGTLDNNGKYVLGRYYSMPIQGGERFTSCVYKGVAYLFNDRAIDADNFKILVHKSAAPEEGWAPGTPEGDDTGIKGVYRNTGNWKQAGLKAIVFNGKMYLFVYSIWGEIRFYTTQDGTSWSEGGRLTPGIPGDQFRAQISVCAVTRYGRPAICLAVAGSMLRPDRLQLSFIYPDNTWENAYDRTMDWVYPDSPISISSGSVRDSIQGNVIQVFGQNSNWWWFVNWTRHTAWDIETNNRMDWVDTPWMANDRQKWMVPCDSIEIPVKAATPGDVRQYIVVFNMTNGSFSGQNVVVCSYESNYLSASPNTQSVDTGNDATADRSCWMLLGAIEGLPPFTRNGNKGETSLSEVEYGRSQSEQISTDMAFEAEVVAGSSFGVKDVFEISGSVKNVFSCANGVTSNVKGSMSNTFKSIEDNADGQLGFLVYAKPTLTSRQYTYYSQDRKIKLNEYVMVNVTSVIVAPVLYDLASPLKGMRTRQKTTDLEWWGDTTSGKGRGDFDYYNQLNRLTENLSMTVYGSAEAKCMISRDTKKSTKISNQTTIKVGGKTCAALKVEGSAAVSMKFATAIETTFGEYFNAKLAPIPRAPTDYKGKKYTTFTVQPAWYIAKDNTSLNEVTPSMPYWVPTENQNQGIVPWCVTWMVSSKSSAAPSQVYDLCGTGKSDIFELNGAVRGGDGTVTVLLNNGAGNWERRTFAIDTTRYDLRKLGRLSRELGVFSILYVDKADGSLGILRLSANAQPEYAPLLDSTLADGQEPVAFDVFDGGDTCSMVLRDSADGSLWMWEIDAGASRVTAKTEIVHAPGADVFFAAAADFNGDGLADILMRDEGNDTYSCWMNGADAAESIAVMASEKTRGLRFIAAGDFNGDGQSDMLLADAAGCLRVAFIRSFDVVGVSKILSADREGKRLEVAMVADFNGDGFSDIAFRNIGSDAVKAPYKINLVAPINPKSMGIPAVKVIRKFQVELN